MFGWCLESITQHCQQIRQILNTMVHFFYHTNWLQKELLLFLHAGTGPLLDWQPFLTQKKSSVYNVQNNYIDLRVSTQKSVLKDLRQVQRYNEKHHKI